ncbi:long-chain-alcohol oxidase FAO4A [Euphorbia lathyris]|uniref:long-chain-alcohol oxidase FAO4A n=1 Tax=Euphorbia lathyris TaxID=212925 RepID=UPI003313660C
MKENSSSTLIFEFGDINDNPHHHVVETKNYHNSLSAREMESLTAICDTFLPPLSISDDNSTTVNFFRLSASMAGTPHRLGGLISRRMKHPKIWLMRLTLWLLSTWIGCFIICGFASISPNFPYFHTFSQLSLHQRQKVLHDWSLSFFPILRMFFKSVKLLTLLVFFSQVDEKNENQTWKAIDYPGPDPQFNKHHLNFTNENSSKPEEQEQNLFGPLIKRIINMNVPRNVAAKSLREAGFSVSAPSKTKISTNPSLIIQCDAVVIGSGSGGGVVAGILANSGYKVVVLEKGSYFARNNLSLLEGPSMDQMYLSGGLLATDDMGLVILAGSTVGGGSTINWSASLRTPKHVIKEWSENYGLEMFDSKLYNEALDVVCEKMGVQSDIHEEGFNNAVLRKGCEELGYPVSNIPRNSPADHYCGWCPLGCKDGTKKGTCETWLLDMVDSGNGVILPECEAVKVLHDAKKGTNRRRATGVSFEYYTKRGKESCVIEAKATIVACGAIGSPPLLKKSGLKNPNIGKHLHLHPVTMAWGYFPESPFGDSRKSYEGGIMTAMSDIVAKFNESGYGAVIQTPSLHPGMFSSLIPWKSGMDMKVKMQRFSRTAHIFALARDKGEGEVKSPSNVSYKMAAEDEENLQQGLEKILKILAAAGAEEVGTHHFEGRGIEVKKGDFEGAVGEESRRGLRGLNTEICSAHQMGSCRMGVSEKESVVNEMGETWEVEGLFLADSSVFPTALGVNPMVTVQAIAYCTAQSILGFLSRKKKC